MEKVKLSELGEILTGNTPSKKNNEFYSSKDICFFKPGDIAEDSISSLVNSEEYISEKARNKARILSKGTILVTCIGTIGKIGIIEQESACNQQINALIPNDKVIAKYLAYLLHSKKEYMQKKANAPVVPIINKKDFSNFEVNICCKEQQIKIVAQLDKIQEIIKIRKKQSEELDQLLKSQFVELFGDPDFNPKNYKIVRLEEIAELNKGITYSPKDVDKTGIIVLRSSNIKGNKFDLNDIVRIHKKIGINKLVQENDILMCNRNGSAHLVGKVAKIPKTDEEMTFGTFMTIIRNKKLYEYLFAYFQTDNFRRQIQFQTAVAINQISLPLLADVKIPLPNENELNKFNKFVKLIDKQKFVKQTITELSKLKEILIAKHIIISSKKNTN